MTPREKAEALQCLTTLEVRIRYNTRRLGYPLTDRDRHMALREIAACEWAADTLADLSPELATELEAAKRRADDIERSARERIAMSHANGGAE